MMHLLRRPLGDFLGPLALLFAFAADMGCAAPGRGGSSSIGGGGSEGGTGGSFAAGTGGFDPTVGSGGSTDQGGDPTTCAGAATAHTYVGCDYWPTVTANTVWSIFDYAVIVANAGTQPADITVTKGDQMVAQATVQPDQ